MYKLISPDMFKLLLWLPLVPLPIKKNRRVLFLFFFLFVQFHHPTPPFITLDFFNSWPQITCSIYFLKSTLLTCASTGESVKRCPHFKWSQSHMETQKRVTKELYKTEWSSIFFRRHLINDQCILCIKWQAAFLLPNPVPRVVAFVCILPVYMFFSCRLPVFASTDTCDKLMTVFLVSVPDHGWDPNTDSLAVQTEDWSQVQKRYFSLFFITVRLLLLL